MSIDNYAISGDSRGKAIWQCSAGGECLLSQLVKERTITKKKDVVVDELQK